MSVGGRGNSDSSMKSRVLEFGTARKKKEKVFTERKGKKTRMRSGNHPRTCAPLGGSRSSGTRQKEEKEGVCCSETDIHSTQGNGERDQTPGHCMIWCEINKGAIYRFIGSGREGV